VTHHIKPGNHWDFDACFEKLSILLPSDRIANDVQRLLERTDAEQNNGVISGLINTETLVSSLASHGAEDWEIDLFLSKYERESVNAGTITWGTMLQHLFGHEEMQRPRLENVISVFAAKRDMADQQRQHRVTRREGAQY
jgi:hypothetical protein